MARVAKPPVAQRASQGAQRRPDVAAVPVRPATSARKPAPTTATPSRLSQIRRAGSQSLQQTATAIFFRESFAELRKVHWPTRQETINMTTIVIVFSLAAGVFLGGLDFLFGQVMAILVGAR